MKVNTVLISEINAEHIEEVARTVSGTGAVMYNIILLLPQHEPDWCSVPDCALIGRARSEAEGYIEELLEKYIIYLKRMKSRH